jgi:CoA:oxalate CoA-transferase
MTKDTDLPLDGLVILDMSQFLSGPYATLRLQDLGARVIKIERPGAGDLSRSLYLSDTEIGGDSTIFHAINRGKESLAIDLKNEADLETAARADRQGRCAGAELPPRRDRAAGA